MWAQEDFNCLYLVDINKNCFGAAVTYTKLPPGQQEEGMAAILSSLTLGISDLPTQVKGSGEDLAGQSYTGCADF